MVATAAAATAPSVVNKLSVKPGGVDPLGLRQINFQLMDLVFPGFNNVARHIRPFTVVAWAWRRAAEIAGSTGDAAVSVDQMLDFTSRIEVIFAWSQFLADREADLPGRDVLAGLLSKESFRFGGPEWKKLRNGRVNSTALTAAITYGPALKSLKWVAANPENRAVLLPIDRESEYLDALHACLEPALEHPAFSSFGEVEVSADDVAAWADLWTLDNPTEAEKRASQTRVFGDMAAKERAAAFELMKAAYDTGDHENIPAMRARMAAPDTWEGLSAAAQAGGRAWREVQARQLFRLSLEGLFYWITRWLGGRALGVEDIASQFVELATGTIPDNATPWLASSVYPSAGLVECLEHLDVALSEDLGDMPAAILAGLATSLAEAPEEARGFESIDRLPLARAARQAEGWGGLLPSDFMSRVVSDWVLAQHTYWAVGRGLQDARARGKSILRLKLILEDGGWTNVPGTIQSRPNPTPDRLGTALSLAAEAGALN